MPESGGGYGMLFAFSIVRWSNENLFPEGFYLVRTHDDFDLITDLDQKVLLEADTLSGIDSVSIKPSFDPESYQKYLQGVQKKRFPFFVTPYAIKLYKTLYEKSLKYYQ